MLNFKKIVAVMALLTGLCSNLFAMYNDIDKGIQLFDAGELEQAKTFFVKFVKENPDKAEGFYYLGRIHFHQRDLKAAEKAFKKAVELQPNSSIHNMWLGRTYGNLINTVNFLKKMGMAGKIKHYYEKALALDESNTDAMNGLITFYIEAPGIAGGSMEKAKQYATKLRELDKLMGHYAFAKIYNKEEKWDLVEQEYKTATATFPQELNVRFQLGYLYQRQERFTEAFEVFEDMIADSATNWAAVYQVGRTGALSGQRLERGEACLMQYLQAETRSGSPSPADAHWRLGMIYEHQNRKDLAREQYKAALELNPKMEQVKKALKKLK